MKIERDEHGNICYIIMGRAYLICLTLVLALILIGALTLCETFILFPKGLIQY